MIAVTSRISLVGRRILRGMSALTDPDNFHPRPIPGWHLPTDLEGFLSVLRRTASFGSTDHARVERFATLPAFAEMPEPLKDDLRRAGLLG